MRCGGLPKNPLTIPPHPSLHPPTSSIHRPPTHQANAFGNLFKRNSVYVTTIFVGAFGFGIGFDVLMTKIFEVGVVVGLGWVGPRWEAEGWERVLELELGNDSERQFNPVRAIHRTQTRASCGRTSGTRCVASLA